MNDTTIFTDDMLAAAVIAYQTNGNEYVKEEQRVVYDSITNKFIDNPNFKRRNSVLVEEFLKDASQASDSVREEVAKIKQFVQHLLTVKILKNDSLNVFDNKMLTVASEVRVSSKLNAIAAYMPKYYELERSRQEIENRLSDAKRDYLADVDSRVSVNLEVVRKNFSVKYDCYFITALTDTNNRVFFAYSGSTPVDVGNKYSVKSTVKRHDADYVTVLSRVKPVKI